ncbi:MAG: M20 family metallo-hydrolase [Gemmatimonadales bacterium]
MEIDRDVLVKYLDEIAACGALPDGGCWRPLYSKAWAEVRHKISGWMEDAGLQVRDDAVGNLWGRVSGHHSGKAVVTGSHMDTVRRGGRLDGALGVVAGLVAVRALIECYGKPKRPIEVLATCEEEGSRFATNFWGARAVVGTIAADEAQTVADADGVTLAQAMAEHDLDPAAIPSAARDDLAAFVELHIEQGGVLETSGRRIGVVTTIVGGKYLRITVKGRPDHAGTTPMGMREDALVAAAMMVQDVEAVASDMGAPAVATVGQLTIEPFQANVVPGKVSFTIDLRHADATFLDRLAQRLAESARRIAASRGLIVEVEETHTRPPVDMDDEVISALESAAQDNGSEASLMVSGAGHDAQILASACPAGMLFVPSIGGRSHCPEEDTDTEDLVLGANVLASGLKKLAY